MEARAEGGAAAGSPPSLFELSGVVVSSAMGTLEREVWGKGGAGVPGLSHCNGGCFTSVLMQFGEGSSESWAVGGLRGGASPSICVCWGRVPTWGMSQVFGGEVGGGSPGFFQCSVSGGS